MFFSNESVPVFIEQGDRRFNVVTTNGNLNKQDWFESDPIAFIAALEEEVPAFAQFLMNWKYDELKAKRVFANEAKETMVSAGMNRFEEFVNKLKSQDIVWFEEHANTSRLFNRFNLKGEIEAKRIPKGKLLQLFLDINDDTRISNISFGKKMSEYGIKSIRTSIPGNVNIKDNYYDWQD